MVMGFIITATQEATGKRIMVGDWPQGKNTRPYLENN
jgi:hypothetical protein